MKFNRITALLLSGLMLTGSLTGCQLAKAEPETSAGTDRLIGAFITTEYLDLFDFEAYLNDNLNDMLDGEVVVEDTAGYQNVIWAELVEETFVTDEGETVSHWNYEFPLEGFAYFAPRITDPETGSEYWSGQQSEEISGGGWHFTSGEAEKIEGSATIYFAPESGAVACYYTNPVYQTEDGRVYLTSGHGSSFDVEGEGGVFSTKLEETSTIRGTDGVEREFSAAISVSFEAMLPIEQVVVLQMGLDGVLLARGEWEPEGMPETIGLDAGTEYLIVESHKKSADGRQIITRELIGQGENYLTTFTLREDGTCIPKAVTVAWNAG